VKLLFDENLSPRLPEVLANVYRGSVHVHRCGLGNADDSAIWQYAKDNGFTIVSKDSDFRERNFGLRRWDQFISLGPSPQKPKILERFPCATLLYTASKAAMCVGSPTSAIR
jgi:hypothetical protein